VIDVDLTPGMRLRCELCATEVVVIRAGSGAIAMTCGGAQLRADAVSSGSGHAGTAVEPARLGKRYTDPDSGVEILCVKGGTGQLRTPAGPMGLKQAAALPASD